MSFTPENFTLWAEISLTALERAIVFYDTVFDIELEHAALKVMRAVARAGSNSAARVRPRWCAAARQAPKPVSSAASLLTEGCQEGCASMAASVTPMETSQ